MYGLLALNNSCFNQRDRNIISSHFCGLCNFLSFKYGQAFRMLTNYDSTFISLLYSAQSSSNVVFKTASKCFLSLNRKLWIDDGLRFAGAISVLMAKAKIYDDVIDEGGFTNSIKVKLIDSKISKAYEELRQLGFEPRAIMQNVVLQRSIEDKHEKDIEALAWPSEQVVSRIFIHTGQLANNETNFESLRTIGKHMGRLMYLLDNYTDLPKDISKKRFNALAACFGFAKPNHIQEIVKKSALKSLNEISNAVKTLNLYRHKELVRKILTTNLKCKVFHLLNHNFSYKPFGRIRSFNMTSLGNDDDCGKAICVLIIGILCVIGLAVVCGTYEGSPGQKCIESCRSCASS